MIAKPAQFLILFLLVSAGSFAQTDSSWYHVDTSIRYNKKLNEIKSLLIGWQQRAMLDHDPVARARCEFNLIRIADRQTEDSLFWQNSQVIDMSLQDNSIDPLYRAILHIMKAKRIGEYKREFSNRGNKYLVRNVGGIDYNAFGPLELDSLIDNDFVKALNILSTLSPVSARGLMWLTEDPVTFLFEPTFADIVHAERINVLHSYVPSRRDKNAGEWLKLSPDEFVSLQHFDDRTHKEKEIFRYYKDWMQYHRSNPKAYYYIESLARKYFYKILSADTTQEKLYEDYLIQLTHSPWNTVKAHGIYQLCLAWNSDAAQYNPVRDEYSMRYRLRQEPFREKYRLHYAKALKLYTDNERMLDSFPVFKDLLQSMKNAMQVPGMMLTMTDAHLPGKAIPAMLRFRNVQNLHTRIVKWKIDDVFFSPKDKEIYLRKFIATTAVTEKVQPLQLPEDYQWHHAFIKIDPLPAGRYIILYSDSTITPENKDVEYMEIMVSRIAMVSNQQQVFVLDRETGMPLYDAHILLDGEKPVKKINKQGYITIGNEDVDWITAAVGNDTLEHSMDFNDHELPQEIFDKEEDDWEEYYEDNTRLHIYTDRAIYRPGQTVHYKGIFITHHPRTGEALVLNWKNFKVPFFKKLLRKFSEDKIELNIIDPFDRDQDTIEAMPDKFGSFSGSFAIPADAATGTWEFSCYDFETEYNSGTFEVEEYKRPSFEILLEKPKQELKLGDTFSVKVIVRSFAGVQLNNVRVKYTAHASSYLPNATGESVHRDDELAAGEAYTNEKGELWIRVEDKGLSKYKLNDQQRWGVEYEFEVQAVDGTGESHEESLSFNVSTQPIDIEATIPAWMERSALSPVHIRTKSAFAGNLRKQVYAKIYKTDKEEFKPVRSLWPYTDIFLYDSTSFKNWFPTLTYETEKKQTEVLVHQDSLLAGGDEKLVLPAAVLKAGFYRMELVSIENGKITGRVSRSFSVFDKVANEIPGRNKQFSYLPYNLVDKGQKMTYLTGNTDSDIFSIYHITWYEKTKGAPVIKNLYFSRAEKKGINEFGFTVPAQAAGELLLTHLYVIDNEVYRNERRIYINDNKAKPEIIVEKYRSRLVPGGKETFSISIKTNNENTAAQLMTTLYDATLDKIEEHIWEAPDTRLRYGVRNRWENSVSEIQINSILSFSKRAEENPGLKLWWLDPRAYGFSIQRLSRTSTYDPLNADVMADWNSIPGLSVTSTKGLNEVVVVGYSSVPKERATGAVVQIRGAASLSSYSKLMVVLDGQIFEGDINTIDAGAIYQALILKGADAVSLWGAKAANGVIVISTKGPVVLPQPAAPPAPLIRKNFSETAFFYPSITADKNGFYNIQFTLPQSVTSWKWKMLAHTQNAVFAYAERTLFSQLPLMAQPDMPRFLYQGDKIVLKTRISNLDSIDMSGQLNCIIEDVVTGEDITSRLLAVNQKSFSVNRSSNSTGSFEISVPENMLNPLRIKISAQSAFYSDGEEHIIPILARKILVSTAVPVVFTDKNELNITQPALPADAEPVGVGLYITPQPQAAMVNGLTWLAHFSYSCAEQTFNKMLAHALAIKIVRTDTAFQRMVHESDPPSFKPLPMEISEETMPWLHLNHKQALQQQRLIRLLDTAASKEKIEEYFGELRQLRKEDGGISWFSGGKSNPYISAYILAGFGKMEKEQIFIQSISSVSSDYNRFMNLLVAYCDKWFVENLKEASRGEMLHYFYARSFWLQQYPLRYEEKTVIDSLLNNYWKEQQAVTIGRQSLLVTVTLRIMPQGHNLYAKALDHLESLRQSAIRDNVNGIRWKPIADEDDLSSRFEEWLVKAAEAFEEDTKDRETIPGIITWLLRNRNDHNWTSTKATADVVSLLRRAQKPINKPLQLEAKINSATMKVSNDLLKGDLFQFTNLSGKSFPSISVSTRETTGNSGSLNYYYFTENPAATDIKIVKTIFRYNKDSWEAISPTTILKPGDKIKTTLSITTPRQLQYVFIDEKRAAACEPADASSGYEYANNLSYYKSVRDIGFQFFAEKIPSGISEISYESTVVKTGHFAWGPAALQCMYRPDIRAYSNGLTMEVKE